MHRIFFIYFIDFNQSLIKTIQVGAVRISDLSINGGYSVISDFVLSTRHYVNTRKGRRRRVKDHNL